LWPTASFVLLGALVASERAVAAPAARWAGPGLALGLVAVGTANLPTSYQVDRPDVYRDRIAATSELTSQLYDVALVGPVAIDQSHMYFGHPFAYPIAVVLRDRGIEYRFDGTMQWRRFGRSRVTDGTEVTRLVLLHGDAARDVRLDPAVVAYVDGPDPVAVLEENA
jgi:hypothetical protein